MCSALLSQAVIEDGILTNRILELQQYLHDRGESARGDYSNLQKAGLEKAVVFMREKEMERAKEILKKLVRILFILCILPCILLCKC